MIRKAAWPSNRTISGVRLCCELQKPEGPKGISALRPWRRNVRCCRAMFIEASIHMFIQAPIAPIWTRNLSEKILCMLSKHFGALLSLGSVDPSWTSTPQVACAIYCGLPGILKLTTRIQTAEFGGYFEELERFQLRGQGKKLGTHTGFHHPSVLGRTGTPVSPMVEYNCRNISPFAFASLIPTAQRVQCVELCAVA